MPSAIGDNLKQRTKQFALRVLKVYLALSRRTDAQVLGKQMIRAGTSVGAQYREALRARSPAEFASKVESAQQELEETLYWFELITEHGLLPARRLRELATEGNALQAILAASAKTTRRNLH